MLFKGLLYDKAMHPIVYVSQEGYGAKNLAFRTYIRAIFDCDIYRHNQSFSKATS